MDVCTDSYSIVRRLWLVWCWRERFLTFVSLTEVKIHIVIFFVAGLLVVSFHFSPAWFSSSSKIRAVHAASTFHIRRRTSCWSQPRLARVVYRFGFRFIHIFLSGAAQRPRSVEIRCLYLH